MKRKTFTNLFLLTVLAFLSVSLLLITLGPAQTTTFHCRIWPNTAAARDEHCKNCPVADPSKEWYCDKNDCDCANRQCLEWSQTPECGDIHVCGAVCNNATAAPDCFPITFSGSDEATVKPTNAIRFANGEETVTTIPKKVWGTAPPGGWCDEKKDCAWKNECIIDPDPGQSWNNSCAYSGPRQNCTVNYLTKWVTTGTQIPNHQEIMKKFPEVLAYGNSDCIDGYVCFQKDSWIDQSSKPKGNNEQETPNPGKVALYRGICVPKSDINSDGTVNIIDITIAAKDFGFKA